MMKKLRTEYDTINVGTWVNPNEELEIQRDIYEAFQCKECGEMYEQMPHRCEICCSKDFYVLEVDEDMTVIEVLNL